MNAKITGAQAMVRALQLEDIKTVFGYPGAAICPFYDALLDSDLHHVLTRTEQGAAHAASGYARASGKTGVCIATSGPGATNLITGIATAYMDSIPLVAITGQVASDLIGSDSFQEVDTTGATSPFTKHNYLVKTAQDLPRIFREAFFLAASGRPGPVLIDVPVDVQAQLVAFNYPETISLPGYRPQYTISETEKKALYDLLRQSKRPIICAGGGVISAQASDALLQLLSRHPMPVITTMMGIGSVSCDHPLYLGTMGSHGTFAANYALHHADLVVLAGARVGNRAMGSAAEIARKAKIVHIDVDPAEIGKNIKAHLPVLSDARLAFDAITSFDLKMDVSQWLDQIESLRLQQKRWPPKPADNKYIYPPLLLSRLGEKAGPDAMITTEVGQNQIWAANHYPIRKPRTFISSGGMGTMGYGLPAALGVKCACPDQTVIAVSGDGSLQMSLQEMGTIKQQKLAVKILLLNNNRLGMVHEIQSLNYNRRYSQVFLEENPDFQQLAAAYGFDHAYLCDNKEIDQALERMLKSDKPYLLECCIDPHEPTLYPVGKELT